MTYATNQEGRYKGPRYFFDFPNIKYAVSANSAGIPNYITIKDYFHLLKPRDDIFREDTIYQEYIVKNGERPDQIAADFYEDEQYYWIILQVNEITDYYNQWPLSQYELDEFITRKYQTTEKSLEIHHYETPEVLDVNKNVLLRAGLTVNKNFQFKYRPDPYLPAVSTAFPIAVTNRSYEYKLNQQKSVIQVLQPKYVFDYAREVQNYALNIPPQESFVNLQSLYSG
jgi:hypothetical protein